MGTRVGTVRDTDDAVLRLVGDALETPPLRDEEWEGTFEGTAGSTEGFSFAMRGRIRHGAGLIAGTGRIVDFRTPNDGLSLDGMVTGGAVAMGLWFDEPDVAREPLACEGVLSTDGDRISGDWTVACLDPAGCDCGGGRGRFDLRRVPA